MPKGEKWYNKCNNLPNKEIKRRRVNNSAIVVLHHVPVFFWPFSNNLEKMSLNFCQLP